MKQYQKVPGGYLVEDRTSIYEIDTECYECLTQEEKEQYFDVQDRYYADTGKK